jgi:hypothetical protein
MDLFRRTHLSPTASIIKFKDFENGIVKLQRGQDSLLTPGEVLAMVPFLKPQVEFIVIEEEIQPILSIVQRAMLNEKRRKLDIAGSSIYIDTSFVNPTSNDPERLFSHAKLTNGDLQQSTTPKNFEARIYLNQNREY